MLQNLAAFLHLGRIYGRRIAPKAKAKTIGASVMDG